MVIIAMIIAKLSLHELINGKKVKINFHFILIKVRAISQCTHTHTHANTLSLSICRFLHYADNHFHIEL